MNPLVLGISRSAGFGWGQVNFIHSSWYGAVFWICAENSADNTDCFIVAEQGLNRAKAFSAPHPTPPARRLVYTRALERTHLGQLTPTDHRGNADHLFSCSAYKVGERKRKGGYLE